MQLANLKEEINRLKVYLIGIAMNMLILSGCTPFQVNLPGSCSVFSNPPQHDSSAEKEKKGFFSKH
ncbi:hypothetical protein [Rickettsiella endosymbiont of Dermanyssus gallinae]|uniref:hypothetical protein n=1 Tax=Rickettsiella endosymbiont of Dermanyssus gallinae TaxID=2856608 RepID=UPI001C532749|nr:hypothetical protein [Rickettsiella endosymbiont of Dermanyssus gallinae]